MKNKFISMLSLALFFACSMISLAGAETAAESTAEPGIVIESSVMLGIFAAAALLGGAFGYWIVRKK